MHTLAIRSLTTHLHHLGMHIAFMLCALAFLAATTAHASPTNAEQQTRFDTLYEQLLSNPGDVDRTLEYAELAVDMGDYEAAIPPLERLLLNNPNSPKLNLELGILYYLLDSHQVAKTYLTAVTNNSNADRQLVQQATSYLQKM